MSKKFHLSERLNDWQDQIHWQDTRLICNQDQEVVSVKNKVPYTVDIKIQKEFPVKVLMVTLTLLLLPASSAGAQAETVLTFRCRIHRVSASGYVYVKPFFFFLL